jgi:gluconolactonase
MQCDSCPVGQTFKPHFASVEVCILPAFGAPAEYNSSKVALVRHGLMSLFITASLIAQTHPLAEDVLRVDPALNKLVPRGAKLEQLGHSFQRTEGPVWSRGDGFLLFTSLNEIIKWTPTRGFSTFADHVFKGPTPEGVKVGPNGLTFDLQGRLLAVIREVVGSRALKEAERRPYWRIIMKENG